MARSGNSKTNYSPVRHMNQSVRSNQFSTFELQDRNHNENEFQAIPSQQQVDADREVEKIAEEVYICDCCGVAKELSPGIKYMTTFRSLFFLFNFLALVFGLANFGLGLWYRIDPKVYEIHKYIETQNFTIAGWIMLFCGFLACIVALVGFTSAVRQSFCSLIFYFVVMIILTFAFVGTLVLLTVYGLGTTLEHFIIKEIYEQIRRRSMSTNFDLSMSGEASQFLDFIQVKMRCCGATDFTDYGKLGMVVPTTCYAIDKNYINAPGCGRAIRNLFDLRAGLAVGFTSASVVSQLITIILSALMFCSIYHWRANSRPVTPISTPIPTTEKVVYRERSPHPNYQRARSRTPIVI